MTIERHESPSLIVLGHDTTSVEVYTKQGTRPPKHGLIVDNIEDAAVLVRALQLFIDKATKPATKLVNGLRDAVSQVIPTLESLFDCGPNDIFHGDYFILSKFSNAEPWELEFWAKFELDARIYSRLSRFVRPDKQNQTIVIGGGEDTLYIELRTVDGKPIYRRSYSKVGGMYRNGFVHLESKLFPEDLETLMKEFTDEVDVVRRFVLLADGEEIPSHFSRGMLSTMARSHWKVSVATTDKEFQIYQKLFPNMSSLFISGTGQGFLIEVIDESNVLLHSRSFPMACISIGAKMTTTTHSPRVTAGKSFTRLLRGLTSK